jgi:hypothetical protein
MQTELNQPIDITIEGNSTCSNPFMARVEGRFVSPSGNVLRLPGFYAKERYGMPYFNSEFGYEHGPSGEDDKTYGVSQTPEEFIQRAYEVVMAGAYPAYYYTYTAWDVIDYGYDPPGAEYFKLLYDFFTSIEWWKFEPSLEHTQPNAAISLVHGEEELVVYPGIRDRERTDIFLTAPFDFREYSGFWMDIFTGDNRDIQKGSLRPNDRGLTHTQIPFDSKTGIMYLRRYGWF